MLLPPHDDPPTKHRATFRLSPAAPAGWLAAVYGNVVVLHLESGRSWVVNCTPSVLEG